MPREQPEENGRQQKAPWRAARGRPQKEERERRRPQHGAVEIIDGKAEGGGGVAHRHRA